MTGNIKAQTLLRAAVNRLLDTRTGSMPWSEYESARTFVEEAVSRAYGAMTNQESRLRTALFFQDEDDRNDLNVVIGLERSRSLIRGRCVLLSMLDIEEKLGAIPEEIVDGARRAVSSSNAKVFLVHGRDDQWTKAVNDYVSGLNLEVVVLREKPGGGRTIIEKLEANSDVGFALVLLTADDKGGLVGEDMKPRARQNVVFELGYFIGLISRSRVIALVEPGVEVFSDISGVQYLELSNSDKWKGDLLKELAFAGLDVKR